MKKRIGFVANSSSSDYLLPDEENDRPVTNWDWDQVDKEDYDPDEFEEEDETF